MVQGPGERQWGSSPSLGKKEATLGPLANLSTHRGSRPWLWLLQVSEMRSEQGVLQGWRVVVQEHQLLLASLVWAAHLPH